ncbi:MAG: outer membrane protein, partial [Pararhizobium sp.]
GVGGGTVRFDDGEIKSDWSESVGIGYHFNDWLRSDVTFEYSDGKFDGSLGGPCVAANPVGTCDAHQDFSAWGFMANGYVDLGTVAGFTPYVGGGVGIMRIGWKDLELSCVGSAACQPVPSHDGENDWRFAWQLSAGMAYAITKNLKLDVGYRYFDIADGGMFDFADADRAFGVSGLQGKDRGLTKQEVRVGLRYDIW